MDVGVDVTGGQAGRREIEGGMPGIWRGDEGNIPAKREALEKFWAIEVRAEAALPSRYVEGRFR